MRWSSIPILILIAGAGCADTDANGSLRAAGPGDLLLAQSSATDFAVAATERERRLLAALVDRQPGQVRDLLASSFMLQTAGARRETVGIPRRPSSAGLVELHARTYPDLDLPEGLVFTIATSDEDSYAIEGRFPGSGILTRSSWVQHGTGWRVVRTYVGMALGSGPAHADERARSSFTD